jgi:hypothetical protein
MTAEERPEAERYVRVTFGVIGLGRVVHHYDRHSPNDMDAWKRNESDLRNTVLSVLPSNEDAYRAARNEIKDRMSAHMKLLRVDVIERVQAASREDIADMAKDQKRAHRDYDAERRTAIGAAEGIMHNVLGYMPDQPGDARKIREQILAWLNRDAVKNNF